MYNIMIQFVLMVMFDWLVALYPVKDVLKCAIIMSGVQFVMTRGMILMLEFYVDRLDSHGQVHS